MDYRQSAMDFFSVTSSTNKKRIFAYMGEKEIKILQQDLQRQHSTVTKSKKAAKKLLLDLGLITPKGNLSTVFKPVK